MLNAKLKDSLSIYDMNPNEVIELAGADGEFFSRAFLSSTFELPSPEFHKDMWNRLENPDNRFVGLEVFRDGAKTTLARAYTLKRIAYGLLNTGFILSESKGHAKRTIQWLEQKIRWNRELKDFFGLEIGKTCNQEEIEIYVGLLDQTATVICQGITGQTRGININDHRPDFILCDDINNEENTGTPEYRNKVSNLFFGAIKNSLAAKSTHPHACMALLATCLAEGDVISQCHDDETWSTCKYSVFDEKGESAWPEKWTTEDLRNEKKNELKKNRGHIWDREKECTITSASGNSFHNLKLQVIDIYPPREEMITVLSVDPVPPPSERQIQMGLKKKDYEVWQVWGYHPKGRFLLESRSRKGHEIDWSLDTCFELYDKWRFRALGVETIAYQLTLARMIAKERLSRRKYFRVIEIADKRKKITRIEDEFVSLVSSGQLFVKSSYLKLLDEFRSFPGGSNDDELDSAVINFLAAEQCGAAHLVEDPYGKELGADVIKIADRTKILRAP